MVDLHRYFAPVILRSAIYAGLLAFITVSIMRLPGKSFHEGGIVEWLQFGFLLLCAILFIYAAKKNKTHKYLSLTLALFLIAASIRECDRFFDRLICDDFWKVGVTAVFILLTCLITSKTKSLLDSALTVINWRAFGMLLSGFLILLFSRLFGHNDFWSDLIGQSNQKTVLRIIEESTELLAYFIFLAGSVEYAIKAAAKETRKLERPTSNPAKRDPASNER